MGNYDMSLPPGRTYKYYSGRPLFEFGSGLSLTTFSLDCSRLDDGVARGDLSFSCKVSNTGSRDGDEVLMAFHSAGSDIRSTAAKAGHPVPIKSLVGFERISVATGRSAVCVLELVTKLKYSSRLLTDLCLGLLYVFQLNPIVVAYYIIDRRRRHSCL